MLATGGFSDKVIDDVYKNCESLDCLEFTGAAMDEMLSHLNIKHKTTVPYTPQQKGVVERIHAVVNANVCRLR